MPESAFVPVLIASVLAGFATMTGIVLVSLYGHWARRNSIYFASFAAGALISVSFLHLIPESMEMTSNGPLYLLAGFLGLYLLNRVMHLHSGHEHNHLESAVHIAESTGVVTVLGIGFHSFIDGVIYSVTFNVSVLTGALAAIGMVLHEVPEGVIAFVILHRAGYSRKGAFLGATLAAAVSTPLGALLSFPFVDSIAAADLGLMLALAGGVLLYVGASHLLPEVERENRASTVLALAAGVFVALVTGLIAE
ncbi:MAG: ZIP family metal transporter [Anaerolineae bacterium]|nr:ZIP family metal transporter [Anaerolineae bacterium]